jgi:toxin ParE1/3/4
MKVALAPLAKADLKDIWRYIYTESGSEKTANRLLDKLGQTIASFQMTPNMGRSRSDDMGGDLRSFPCGNYVIFYRIDKGVVRVIRILHGSRDIPAILG